MEELESVRAEPLEPADGSPPNENEREHQQVGCSRPGHAGLKRRNNGGQLRAVEEELEKLTTRRRNERISTVSQEATNEKLESARE